jgi:hypothetical protein
MFESPPQNFHNSESVEIDIIRSEEDVAIAIEDLSAGYRMNQADLYTNKEFVPPIFKEAITINANTLLKRVAGNDPFADVSFQASLTARIFQGMPKPAAKIHRAIELQASQILQTGIVTLIDSNGTALYTLDYKPKATHFPQTANTWGASGETPLADLENLCDVIRADGLAEADEAIFGANAWTKFIQNDDVKALLDNRRMVLGGIAPEVRGQGAKFMGFIEIGDCRLNMWIYSGRYKHPQTGTSTRFMHPDKVIVRASSGRLDATFGNVPRIVPPDARVAPFLPTRVSSRAGGMDLHPNAWIDQTGENLYAGVSSRPLLIPTAIDTYGCLNTIDAGDS